MNTDEKIKIANDIYKKLINVQRGEWNKWVSFFKAKKDWSLSLKLAFMLSESPMLRPGPRDSYRKIYKAISDKRKILEKMKFSDVIDIFGYISWKLAIPIGFGMWKYGEEGQ